MTRARVGSPTGRRSFRTFDTVITETPAARATSAILTTGVSFPRRRAGPALVGLRAPATPPERAQYIDTTPDGKTHFTGTSRRYFRCTSLDRHAPRLAAGTPGRKCRGRSASQVVRLPPQAAPESGRDHIETCGGLTAREGRLYFNAKIPPG
ncbi:hypothetical protein GCM10009774_27440 [Cellulomonas gelida]|uniref:Uncharacterized protein n=1 Tax=Cellulomonas gelida TaxID=1712 RepID=A0A4Y3KG37_9CELL|nr:hypothetical protein CGE01nite_02080 [Cellulomonas gelida]GGL35416.1 hypothetical protein GCM10009774_27440 [Cellulomonas gelida]